MEKTFLDYIREKAENIKNGIKNTFSPITENLNKNNVGGDWKNLFIKGGCIVMATLTLGTATVGMVAEDIGNTKSVYSTIGSMPSQTSPLPTLTTPSRKTLPTLSSNSTTTTHLGSTTQYGTTTTGTTTNLGSTTSTSSSTSAEENTPFNIWSYNILTETTSYKHDKANRWDSRKNLLVDQIKTASPDIICFQEVTSNMNTFLSKNLSEYDVSFQTKSTSPSASHLAIYYKRDRYDLIDSGKFWLSDTPLQESNSFGTDRRICAWTKLHDKVDDTVFYVYNIHYTYKSQDKEARQKSSELINKATAGLDAPVILLGDFNANTSEPAYKLLDGPFINSLDAADTVVDSGATYNGFKPNKYSTSKAIDHIWLSNNSKGQAEFSVSSYCVEDDYSEEFMAEYGTEANPVRPVALSDHWAVSATVTLDSSTAEYYGDSVMEPTSNSGISFPVMPSGLPETTEPRDPLEAYKKRAALYETEPSK